MTLTLSERLFIAAAVALFGLLFGTLGFFFVTERACLQAGYRDAKITVTFGQYCIKRVEQTDIVVPLEHVEARGG